MALEILSFTLGMVSTNTYILADPENGAVVCIDPAWDGLTLLAACNERGWRCNAIWLTHAHFDHIGGLAEFADGFNPIPQVALHPDDYWLWRVRGGAPAWGIDMPDPGPEPTIDLVHGQVLHLGQYQFEVRHCPGHTPGHVIFYCAAQNLAVVGDVIFRSSIGRTDLPRGDHAQLIDSIQQHILSLPDDTRLLNGHGPETTVGSERQHNPFL
jgi:glyoxylase-like metal-dependent hydrolase (beta-lactamase superfamily II)